MQRNVVLNILGNGSAPQGMAEVNVSAVSSSVAEGAVTVGALPLWGTVTLWILSIVLMSQAVKSVLKLSGLKEKISKLRWQRLLYVMPIGVGMALSHVFAPTLGSMFGLHFNAWTSTLVLGPGSGAAAAFAYDVCRKIILPVLPRVVVGVIERITGVEMPDADLGDLTESSDADVD